MVRPFCSCYIASDNFSQEGIPLSILPALMSGRQRGWLCRNVVLNLRVGGGVVGSRPALFRFPTHQLLNREAPKMYRHPSILTLYYYFFFPSLLLDFTQMTSRQLSDFFERSFRWAPCLPCRTASLPYQS